MMQTLFLALALAANPAAPPSSTQLPPPPPPLPGPSAPLIATEAPDRQPPDTRPYVALVTDLGTIVLRIEDKRAPVTAANFLRYVATKRMDGYHFYRSTRNWGPASQLIQAGNRGDPRRNYPPIAHEATNITGLTNCKGAVSMARSAPGDATSGFFLLLSDIPGFDADPAAPGDNAGFAVFGELVSGGDVAEKIFAAPVSPTAGQGVMVGQMITPMIAIKSARRVPAPADAPKGCIVKAG